MHAAKYRFYKQMDDLHLSFFFVSFHLIKDLTKAMGTIYTS